MSNSGRFFEGLLLGGILGAIAGVLFAPKSGREMRKHLVDSSDEIYKNASTQISDAKDRTEQALQDFQSKSDGILKQATRQFEETRDQLTTKIQEIRGNKGSAGDPALEPETAQHM